MILLIDNYDSFVHNLARYVQELGETPLVRRHDALTVDQHLRGREIGDAHPRTLTGCVGPETG